MQVLQSLPDVVRSTYAAFPSSAATARYLGSQTDRDRSFNQAPCRDGKDARLVNRVGITIADAKGKVIDENAFVTSLPVTRETVA